MLPLERMSLDLDSHSSLKLMQVYYNLRYLGLRPVVSRTHKGFHVKANIRAERSKILELRRSLADDPNRLWLSELRLRRKCFVTFDLCFSNKRQRNGQETREQDTREPLEPQYFRYGGLWRKRE